MVRFVHTADIHLDRPFRGLHETTQRVAAALAQASFDAFNNIIDFAVAEQVDALLIAGDLFDSADRSIRAQVELTAGIERLDAAGIRTAICHGMHDPLDSWTGGLRLPPSCTRFGPEPEAVAIVDDAEVVVAGVSQVHRITPAGLSQFVRSHSPAAARCVVGLLHDPAIDPDSTTVPDIDYLALGGDHQRNVTSRADPVAVYPGTPQAFEFRECGPRGAYLVEIDGHDGIVSRFQALDAIRLQEIVVGNEQIATMTELLDHVAERIDDLFEDAQGRPVLYRVRVTGHGPLRSDLVNDQAVDRIKATLNDQFGDRRVFAWCDQVRLERPAGAGEATSGSTREIGARIHQAAHRLRTDPAERDRLWAKLLPLIEEARLERFQRELGFDEDDVPDLVKAAEDIVRDMLDQPS